MDATMNVVGLVGLSVGVIGLAVAIYFFGRAIYLFGKADGMRAAAEIYQRHMRAFAEGGGRVYTVRPGDVA